MYKPELEFQAAFAGACSQFRYTTVVYITAAVKYDRLDALCNGISFELPDNTTIIVKGIDNQAVGQVAAKIRAKRPPEPYLGKGIKYDGEKIRRKAGKTGK